MLKQWNEDKINNAVAEIIGKLVNNPKFENEIRKKIGNSLKELDWDNESTVETVCLLHKV